MGALDELQAADIRLAGIVGCLAQRVHVRAGTLRSFRSVRLPSQCVFALGSHPFDTEARAQSLAEIGGAFIETGIVLGWVVFGGEEGLGESEAVLAVAVGLESAAPEAVDVVLLGVEVCVALHLLFYNFRCNFLSLYYNKCSSFAPSMDNPCRHSTYSIFMVPSRMNILA